MIKAIHQRTENQNIQGSQKTKLSKIHEPIQKWATELNRTFFKRRNSNGQKTHENCSPSLAIKEI
jgi:hypothetical protein